MLKKLRKTDSEGFTIIEVMIVLAIAALILLIVFLAVPALQRSSRNTSRKSDAGHLSAAVNDFVTNNSGTLPGNTGGNGASWATDCATIVSDAGTLSQLTSGNSFGCGASVLASGTVNAFDEQYGTATITGLAGQAVVLDENAQCPATSSTAPATVAATSPRQAALLYTVEQSSGNWLWDCIQSE
jgi:prepilin-type N-terminal cleavage/methylation domain-containing protein